MAAYETNDVWFYLTIQYGGILVSDVLLSVDVPVVADVDCDAYYGGTNEKPEIYPSMLCAGNTTDGIRYLIYFFKNLFFRIIFIIRVL
jgi:hypothetical protein